MFKKKMFRIHLPRGSYIELREDLTDTIRRTSEMDLYALELSVLFDVSINGRPVLDELHSCHIHMIFQRLNNALYDLLTTNNETRFDFLPGLGFPPEWLTLRREEGTITSDSNVSLIGKKGRTFIRDVNETCNLFQVVKETVRAVNDYKDFSFSVVKKNSPELVSNIMISLFGKEERYTAPVYDNNKYDWQEYCREHGWPEPPTIHRAKSEEDATALWKQYVAPEIKDKKPGEYTITHYIVHDYYNWKPLESKWREVQSNFHK